ncbi:nuclear transport factor 2 family protein [Halioxenophilus sp. WMMB6]|uniref:nuclear transport factor 2 family protein n=1 Tax=Halioxenophilus sp. WMMB6 TaxID=3073815 RepID=UPI00295F40D0|nr:nuclear transport factor 2 family protein [Halioxenophilus sp. WMMB6]
MSDLEKNLAELIDKESIRELALLYCRGVDRKDGDLLRTLYTEEATDTHGDTFDGGAAAYVDFLEKAFPYMTYSGHHICNHLIAVNGDTAEGEIYALAYHILPDGKGGQIEDFMCVRYLDKYQRCTDGRWRFAQRVVNYDVRQQQPTQVTLPENSDPGVGFFSERLFAKGPRQ